ncbi:hypothetical protein [Streptomyces aidingensis]|uniref:Uncharacterized protein n=1 Tax=Streptomyces aidingensis TaxID=910347 RepID=A0A1I1M9W4_9ACTN|nr:hypothetical protein [Streptomyces aidingensis]SFC79988.1 hypothetical protein SAMN05421773_10688 [Streptomyces aidingensis]
MPAHPEVTELLRSAAQAHRPDRDRMLEHIRQGMAAAERSRSGHAAPRNARGLPTLPGLPGLPGGRSGLPGLRGLSPAWMRAATAAAALVATLGGVSVAVTWSQGSAPALPGPAVGGGTQGAEEDGPDPRPGQDGPDAGGDPAGEDSDPQGGGSGDGGESGRNGGDGDGGGPAEGTGSPGTGESGTGEPGSGTEGTGGGPAAGGGDTRGDGTAGQGPQPGDSGQGTTAGTAVGVGVEAYVEGLDNPHWSQPTIRLTAGQPVDSLTLQLRITPESEVRNPVQWQNFSEDAFVKSVRQDDGALVYVWELKPDAELPDEVFLFAVGFEHPDSHRTDADSYSLTGSGPDGPFAADGEF